MDGEHGPCVKCGFEDELDNQGLCVGCHPTVTVPASLLSKQFQKGGEDERDKV